MYGHNRSPSFATAEIEIFLDLLSGKRGDVDMYFIFYVRRDKRNGLQNLHGLPESPII